MLNKILRRSDLNINREKDQGLISDISSMGGKESLTTYDMLLRLPEIDLRKLCGILVLLGLKSRTNARFARRGDKQTRTSVL